ncbi:HK97 gp10 family phage protein [Alkalibacterium sp. f15]|uniref:HK97 gp10 family phage protein n=1 Tax=Alkalibacterium sp. f15 TaxID=3414029 RepID=UPI003BF8CF3F
MAKVEMNFESNLPEAKQKLQSAQKAGLIAALLVIEKYAKNYSRTARQGGGGTRDSYTYELNTDGVKLIGAVGSDEMNAIYEEYGTGEFAEKGDGRKGGWVYYDDVDGKFYFTYGKTPNKPLRRAGSVSRSEVQQLIGEHFSLEF